MAVGRLCRFSKFSTSSGKGGRRNVPGEPFVETARKFPQFINIRLAATWRRNYTAGFQCLYGHSQPTFSRPTSNGPRGPIHATVLTVWREKPLLNLRKDFMEPLFGTFSFILIVANVGLQAAGVAEENSKHRYQADQRRWKPRFLRPVQMGQTLMRTRPMHWHSTDYPFTPPFNWHPNASPSRCGKW